MDKQYVSMSGYSSFHRGSQKKLSEGLKGHSFDGVLIFLIFEGGGGLNLFIPCLFVKTIAIVIRLRLVSKLFLRNCFEDIGIFCDR